MQIIVTSFIVSKSKIKTEMNKLRFHVVPFMCPLFRIQNINICWITVINLPEMEIIHLYV